MKKIYLLACLLSAMAISQQANSQTYSAWALSDTGFEYDTIQSNYQNLPMTFSGIPIGAWGPAKLVLYYQGNFGYNSNDINVIQNSAANSYIGTTMNHQPGIICGPEDSTIFNISTADLLAWQSSGEITFTNQTGYFNNFSCDTSRIRMRLEFEYCSIGVPESLASINSIASICPESTVSLTNMGSPAGGIFTGQNVSGDTFSSAGLSPGSYNITYTQTDSIGCTTSDTKKILISAAAANLNYLSCEGLDTPELSFGTSSFVFSNDLAFANIIDTSTTFNYGPLTQSPTTVYYGRYFSDGLFHLDTVTGNNSMIVDHENYTGDDRGGIAVTDKYVYVVGDNSTGRYNLDLTNPVSLPRRDGIFSDLKTLKIWSLYNTSNQMFLDADNIEFTVDAIIALDDSLNPTTEVILLTDTLVVTNDYNNIMLAGYGKLGIHTFGDSHTYIIDIETGLVTDLGLQTPYQYGSENWAEWGVLSYDGTDYIGSYRDGNLDNIVSYNFTTQLTSTISNFTDVSDLSSFVYHSTTNRVYFHYENNGQFGGNSETLGYLDANATITEQANGTIGCIGIIEYTFNSIDLGTDIVACQNEAPVVIEAGFGFESYTWNGDNNDWNIFPVTTSGDYILEVVDSINCTLTDTINVTFESCAGIDELAIIEPSIYPVPNNGAFEISFPTATEVSEVAVFDMSGKQVWKAQFNESLTSVRVNADNLMNGVYFVQITSKEFNSRIPIVVSN
jgi:hypothetical protein